LSDNDDDKYLSDNDDDKYLSDNDDDKYLSDDDYIIIDFILIFMVLFM